MKKRAGILCIITLLLFTFICWGWRGEIRMGIERRTAEDPKSFVAEEHVSEWTVKGIQLRLRCAVDIDNVAAEASARMLAYLDIGPILWVSLDEAGEWGYSVKVVAGFGASYYLIMNRDGRCIEIRKGERLGEVFYSPFYDTWLPEEAYTDANDAFDLRFAQDRFYMKINAMKYEDLAKFIVCHETVDGIQEFAVTDTKQIRNWIRFLQSIEVTAVAKMPPDTKAPYSFCYMMMGGGREDLFHSVMPNLGFEYDEQITLRVEKCDEELLTQLMDEMDIPNAMA